MPGKHGKDKEKDMMEEKDKDMEKHNPYSPDKYAAEDLYRKEEDALAKAKEMGLEQTHSHVHVIDDEEVTLYMPGKDHDEYMKAKVEMENDKENAKHEDKEKEMGAHDKDKEEDMGKHEDDEKEMGKHKDDEKDMGAHEDDEDDDKKEKKMSKGEDCDCDENKEICDDSCEPSDIVANHSIEQTFNLNGVEIFSTGVWNGDKYTKKDLEAMVSNFDKTGFQPPRKLGHNEDQPEMKDGDPALGYVDKIYTAGTKLLADFHELPQKVYDAMKRGNYKRVSSEIYWNYKNNGSVLDRVLKAVALLGSEIPAVTNLEAIEGLYSKDNGSGEVKKHYTEKESELMEKDFSQENQELKEKLQKAYDELEKSRSEKKEAAVAKFISDQKEAGRVLPIFEKELHALLMSATDSKVYSYTVEENTVELSQSELVEKVFSSMPKLIEFAEISEDGEFVIDRQPYDHAGDEVDRRAGLYIKKGKAKNYSEALDLVFKEDEQLKEEYYKQQ